MSSLDFILQPFAPAISPAWLEITGRVERRSSLLAIRYALLGQLADLAVPPPAETPSRRHRLWEETCLEFFLAHEGSKGSYREFNLSPSGHWNVYIFSDYRDGMREEPNITALPFRVFYDKHLMQIHLELDLSSMIPTDCTLQIGISAVIVRRDGVMSYWALKHPGPRPDFHHRDGFGIQL